jgi:hypothetical protein
MEASGNLRSAMMKLLGDRRVQLSALVALLAGIGIYALRTKYSVLDPDTWWHLKVGEWILRNSALPHTGILSRTAAQRPWVAYSWGYEILLSLAYSWFGILGIGIFGTALTIGVGAAAYGMLRRLSGRFWLSCLLAAITCWAFLFNGAPRPVFFSYILFCVTLTLLFEAQRNGRIQLLYWLPLVFLVWANLHIQFIYGLFTVSLFVGIHLTQKLLSALKINTDFLLPSTLPAMPLVAIFALCYLATVLGPNTYHPYLVVLAYTKAKFPYKIISELQAVPFRLWSNFVELFLAAAGFYAVGWRKKIDAFKLALLVIASIVAFRTMRDAWFLGFPAAACIADFPVGENASFRSDSWREFSLVAAAVILFLFVAAPFTDFNTRALDSAVSAGYPVNAINFLRRGSFSGPLYNNLNWGGFLMWYLPELPVAIDGRNDLYGDDLDELFYNSEFANPSYATDSYLNDAGLVVLESRIPLARTLTTDPRFRLVYQDQIATVFVRR